MLLSFSIGLHSVLNKSPLRFLLQNMPVPVGVQSESRSLGFPMENVAVAPLVCQVLLLCL